MLFTVKKAPKKAPHRFKVCPDSRHGWVRAASSSSSRTNRAKESVCVLSDRLLLTSSGARA